jgi:Leucine-rich repeat (LRR) protein
VTLTHLYLSNNQISDVSAVSGLVNLSVLDLGANQISDVSPLSGLVSLTSLDLWYNQVSDLNPLVLNAGIDSGDLVDVMSNPLDTTSCTVHIPTLQGRGVTVDHDCT